MKTFNFFEKLWEHGRTLKRVGLVLVMCLTLGVTHVYAKNGNKGSSITVYTIGCYFSDPVTWDYANSSIKIDVRRDGDSWSSAGSHPLWNQAMTNTGKTYLGFPVYSYTFDEYYEGAEIRFKHYVSSTAKEDYGTGWTGMDAMNGKLYLGYFAGRHNWVTYGDNIRPIYLDLNQSSDDWTTSSATFTMNDGTSTVYGVKIKDKLYAFSTTKASPSTLKFKRMSSDGSSEWNSFSVSYSSSYNTYKVTNWNAGTCANDNINLVNKTTRVYYDNSQLQIDKNGGSSLSYKYFVIGHDNFTAYSKVYTPTSSPLSNTKLYYFEISSDVWRDATYYGFVGVGSSWSSASWGSSNLSNATKYTAAYKSQFDLGSGHITLFVPASGSNGAAITPNYMGTTASSMNVTQTVQYALSIDGGTTYTNMSSGNTPGQISISAYKFSNGTYNSVNNTSNTQTISGGTTGTYSKSVPAAYTGKTTYSKSSDQTGYSFVGWYDGDSELGTGTSYTDYPTSAKTITARYKANQVTLTLNGNSGTGHTASVKATYGVSTLPSITNPTRDGYVFAGWFTGSGGTGKLVIDIDGSLQPGISSYTDADGNWINTSNVTLYAAWLTVHTPGAYMSTYGQPLTISSCEAYEVYRYAVSGSTIYFNAGGESAPITSSDPRNLFSFSQTSSSGACDITWSGWVGHTQVYGKGADVTFANGEFKAHSVCQPTCRDQQGVIMCVSGYSQFSIYAQDADNTGKKHFKVFINGVEQAMTLSKGFTVRRFDLTPANTYVIRVTGQTDNNNLIQGISLKVPDYPAPTALAASALTSTGATLTVTDDHNSNNYEFYVKTSSTAPTAGSSATHSVISSKSIVIDDLDPETTYYAWARAKCSSTKSAWTALAGSTFTTLSESATLYNVTAVTSTGDDTKGTVEATDDELAEDGTTTITASPATGYQVTNWAVSGTGASIDPEGDSNETSATLTMGAADATVTVTFGLKDYTVDYNTPSNGNYTTKVASGSATSADKTAQMGQTVALVATPSSGYAFASWTITNTDTDTDITSTLLTGSKSTTASTSFTMPAANISIVATFAKTYTVEKGTYTNGDFTIATSPAISGATITLTATANTGYVFDHWVVKKTSNSSDVTSSVSISNAKVSPATFTMPSYDVTVDAVFKATPNIYYYKDAGHYNGSTYKNPAKGTASGTDDVTLTTPWKFCDACVTGVDSVVATTGTYDNKGNWMNAYLKVPKGGNATSKNIIFGISAGYTAVISIKIGGYKNNPSVTLKEYSGGSLGSDITKTTGYATVGGVATTENNFNEIRWSSLEAGVYVLNVSSENAYISEIDIQTTPKNYTITLNNQSATTGGTANIAVTFDATTNLSGTPAITVPEKTGYTFGGYYTATGGSGTQIIDEDGNVNASASDASYTYTSATKQWKYANNIELYAKWTAKKYTITLVNECVAYSNGTHTCGEATEFEATYDANYFTCYQNTAPSSFAYEFGGYYSAAGGGGDLIITDLGSLVDGATVYTDASGNWTYDGEPTVYAKWTAELTTGLSSGIHTNGGSGGAITLTYNSSATSGFTPSTRSGYILAGYYTAATDGDKVINADGTIVSGTVEGYVTSGKWAYCGSSIDIYAQWTPITYTIAFDKNDDASYLNSDSGTDPDDIAATYAVSYTIPACPYTRTGYSFVGWSTAAHKAKGSVSSTPALDYDYRGNYPASNLSSTQGATVTLYPKWQGNEYTISFNARGGSVYPTSINVRYGETYGTGYYGELPEPLAPTGKEFIGWYTSPTGGTQVTATTVLTTAGAHTLYARYSDIAMVYFKNTIGWEDVFVTYDAYWDNTNGTGNYGKIYHKMTQIYGTNIYYDRIPATILASWKGDIAFNSEELLTGDKHAPQDEGNYGNYNKGEVVFRHDFDSRATMFVPKDVNTNNTDGNYQKNSAQYISTGYKDGTTSDPEYTSGYWMKYGETYSGYLFSYQKALSGSWSTEYGMNTSVAGDTIFVYTMAMDANTRYDFRFRKDCQTTNTKSRQFRYGTQITSAACTDLKLVCDPNNNSWMQTTTAGEYKFILTCKKDGHMYLTVEYPLAVNDYQVLYSWSDGSAKTYASEVIKAHPDTVDTISVFVHKLESPVVSRSMKIQKCTGINGSGVPTWTDVTGGGIDLTDVTTTGVYNFEITQPETGDPTGAFAGKYEADYYIRTACSDGGWDQYLEREDNVMTYSAYSMTQTLSDPYSHYYCRYVGSTSTDITFAIATKYSPNISGTKTGDATIGNAATTLPANANVRFSWNEETNAMARAYIKDAQGPSNARFLVMHGAGDDMIFNPDGSDIAAAGSLAANELQFDDKGDWVYQVMLQAKPGAQVSIIAKYGSGEGVDRYLVGGPSSYETIMGGEGEDQYTIMAIYDFKTNRLMNAWTPSGTITEELSDVDMLWIRYKQQSAQQITFSGDGKLTDVTAVGAIRLDYNDLVGHVASWTYETRPLLRYFISFPFDVNVSDIFGLHGAELGREFVIRKYDGAERAKNGLFLGDGDTYWVDLTMDSVMHANEGYSLVFDNEYLNGDLGSIWENKTGGSSVYLYFPAAAKIASISDVNKGTTLAEHVCQNTKTYTYGGVQVSHTNSDSHWNLIGSPLFVDSYVYSSSGTNGQAGDKERTTLDSYYAYNTAYNYWEPELYYKGGEYYTCHAMHAMLVQFAGSVTWSKNAPAAPAGVAARERQEATVTNNLITLNLLQNGEESDHTYIKMDENGNSDFMLCEDMYKIINKSKPNIFTYAGDNCVAYNKVAIESQTINVGVEIRKNGTYTFEMPENVAGQVTLIDTFDGTRTNLNLEDYEIYLNRGSYYDRFLIEINPNNAPTAIDGVTDGSGSLKDGKAHKFIMNDMMYILKDGVLYDAQGKRVQ